jgi:hypothetical protein
MFLGGRGVRRLCGRFRLLLAIDQIFLLALPSLVETTRGANHEGEIVSEVRRIRSATFFELLPLARDRFQKIKK